MYHIVGARSSELKHVYQHTIQAIYSWATLHSHILVAIYIPLQYQSSIQQYILYTDIWAYEESVDIQYMFDCM